MVAGAVARSGSAFGESTLSDNRRLLLENEFRDTGNMQHNSMKTELPQVGFNTGFKTEALPTELPREHIHQQLHVTLSNSLNDGNTNIN